MQQNNFHQKKTKANTISYSCTCIDDFLMPFIKLMSRFACKTFLFM